MEVTDATFSDTIIESKGFRVVDFWAPWCGPCRLMEPALVEATKELDIPMYKLLVDTNNIIPTRYAVQGIPTVILFHDGKEVGRMVGAHPKRKIIETLKHLMDKTTSA